MTIQLRRPPERSKAHHARAVQRQPFRTSSYVRYKRDDRTKMVADFAGTALGQDGEASEMSQRGLRSPAFRAARLMLEEYEIHRFQTWILAEMAT